MEKGKEGKSLEKEDGAPQKFEKQRAAKTKNIYKVQIT